MWNTGLLEDRTGLDRASCKEKRTTINFFGGKQEDCEKGGEEW